MARCCVLTCWSGGLPITPNLDARSPQLIGLVLAGNLPMVGWARCAVCAVERTSCLGEMQFRRPGPDPGRGGCSRDSYCANRDVASRVEFVTGTLEGADAVIATGSANTNRYFEYYFRGLPRVLRSQRTSIACSTVRKVPMNYGPWEAMYSVISDWLPQRDETDVASWF